MFNINNGSLWKIQQHKSTQTRGEFHLFSFWSLSLSMCVLFESCICRKMYPFQFWQYFCCAEWIEKFFDGEGKQQLLRVDFVGWYDVQNILLYHEMEREISFVTSTFVFPTTLNSTLNKTELLNDEFKTRKNVLLDQMNIWNVVEYRVAIVLLQCWSVEKSDLSLSSVSSKKATILMLSELFLRLWKQKAVFLGTTHQQYDMNQREKRQYFKKERERERMKYPIDNVRLKMKCTVRDFLTKSLYPSLALEICQLRLSTSFLRKTNRSCCYHLKKTWERSVRISISDQVSCDVRMFMIIQCRGECTSRVNSNSVSEVSPGFCSCLLSSMEEVSFCFFSSGVTSLIKDKIRFNVSLLWGETS